MSKQFSQPTTTDDLRQLTGAPSAEQPLVSEQDFAVESVHSPRPPWTKPIPKLMLVAIALTPVFAFAGLFLVGSQQSRQKEPGVASERQSTQGKPESGTKADELAQVRQENAQLKAKAALDGQQQLKTQMNQSTDRKKTIKIEQTRTPAPARPSQQVQSTPAVVRRSEPPRIVSATPPPSAVPTRATRVSTLPTEPPRSIEEQSADAMQRWQRLARLGSYGSVRPEESVAMEWSQSGDQEEQPHIVSSPEVVSEPSVPIAHIAPTSAVQISYRTAPPSSRPGEQVESVVVPTIKPDERNLPATIAASTPEETSSPTTPILQEAEARILEEPTTPPALIAGASSSGVVATPLVIDTGKKQDRFAVVLAEPLMDSKGHVAIPAQTQLMVQVEEVSPTGRVQLSATTAAWQEHGLTKEVILPAGVLQIRGKNGEPLIAKQYTDKGKEIAALDAGQFLLGAVRRSAQLYTRSNTRVQTGTSTTVVTEENPPPNILAGALEGGTDAILDTISERNQRAVEEIQQRPPIHFIEAGRPVQVFVNQSMQLPM